MQNRCFSDGFGQCSVESWKEFLRSLKTAFSEWERKRDEKTAWAVVLKTNVSHIMCDTAT